MVAISPIRALRYNADQFSDLTPVIAPPYDVITPDEQERLYAASPHNVVRLILGKQSASDTDNDNRYTRAQRDFSAWRQGGALRADAAQALYVIRHTFREAGQARTRLGFIALLGLDDATVHQVYRHEATLAAPKVDRTKLMEAIPANLEPIFCVYPDDGGGLQQLLAKITTGPATAVGRLGDDQVQLWVVSDKELVKQVQRGVAASAVLIADGHHRFEVAKGQRQRYPWVMSYFASMADPALEIRPIHRVVDAPLDLAALGAVCTTTPARDLDGVMAWLKSADGQGRFGAYDGRAYYQVEVTPPVMAQWLMAPTVPLPLATLDVSILHGLVLPRLGVNGAGVTYTGNLAHAVQAAEQPSGTTATDRAGGPVARGGEEMPCAAERTAWLLRGIPLAQVFALASQGLLLSPKSTYFYPKVPSGLVMNPWDVLP